MKSYREQCSKQEKFSIRKLSVGVVSLAVAGLATVNTYGAEVKADEETGPATEVTATDTVASSKLTSTTVTEGNKTVTTTYVESPELEKAKAAAVAEGVTVTEEAEKVQPSIAAAEADNKTQTAEINTVVENYKKAKAEYEAKSQEITLIEKRNAEAEAKYKSELATYNEKKEQYELDFLSYQAKLAQYQELLKQYKIAKKMYDSYMEDNGFSDLKNLETVQDLTFQRETNAIHQIDGINTYLTKDAQARLNTSNVHQYDSNKLMSSDIVSTSPWTNRETEYILVREGDKFVVTYDNLNKSSIRENVNVNPIKRVIYRYEIISLPSNDGKGIAAVSADPTVTLTVGASTDKLKPVKVAVDVEFYDGNGRRFDLTKHNAIVALNSLNHWTGASYVESGDKPRALTVEAKDKNGNTVRGTWNPYADGSSMSIEHNAVVVKNGIPDFGSAEVTISAENPIKIVAQKTTFNGSEFVVSEETVIDATSVNVSGTGNGHNIGTDNYTLNGKDDIIGVYTINSTTGELTFTPKKKFETLEHIESVNIGNNKYIAIPNSSVSYDPTTKEVKSLKDNQYIEHGSAFNGETSSALEGWDNPDSKYLYYGGAGLKMLDGHLVFTANGANAKGQPTVYWFAINSEVAVPKNPGKEPEKPTAPIPPTAPTPPTLEVVPNAKPVKPEARVKWHKNKVVTETDIPTPPTPVPPTPYNPPTPIVPPTPEIPEQPVQPAQPQTPALPNTGTESSTAAVLAGAMTGLFGLGLARKKKED